MSQLKKRHHYVWQYYLKSWTDSNKQLYCLLLDRNKIIRTKTEDIAQKKNFYKLQRLSKKDIDIVMILTTTDNRINPLNDNKRAYIDQFIWPFLLEDLSTQMSTENKKKLQEHIEKLKSNTYEDIHYEFEKQMLPILLLILNKEDLSFFDNDGLHRDFIEYLAVQYMRTKAIKNRVYSTMINDKKLVKFIDSFEKTWNLVSLLFATTLSYNLIENKNDFKLVLLKNNTNTPLITGDQPIINTYTTKDDIRNNIEAENMELYYPISPTLAILMTKNEQNITTLTREEVVKYNSKIIINSSEQIYSNNESYLEHFLT